MNSIKKIKRNRQKGMQIENIIAKEKNLEQKLLLLKYLSFYYSNNISGLYYSEFIEKNLINISESIKFDEIDRSSYKNNSVLHVVTIPFEIGGHTRVVSNWIGFDTKRKHSIIVNQPENSTIPEWLKSDVRDSGGNILLNKSLDIIEKAKYLRKVAAGYEKVVLHVHNWDIVPILAFGNREWHKTIYLYNHSDHLFWVGVSITDVLLDLTNEGMKNSKDKRGIRKSFVLPIPIKGNLNEKVCKISINKRNKLKIDKGLLPDSKIILSMANDYKYNTVTNLDFGSFAKKAVHLNPNTFFLIIGANKKRIKWKVLEFVSKGRIRAEGYIKREEIHEFISITDIYVDSFPLNSYTSLLEAASYGIPSFYLKTPVPALDCVKMLECSSQDELISKINYTLNSNIENIPLSSEIERFHGREAWTKRLDEIFDIAFCHNVNLPESKKEEINKYDKYLYEVNSGRESLGITIFKSINLKNKLKIIFVLRKKIFDVAINIIKLKLK